MADVTIVRVIDLECAGLEPPAGVTQVATVDLALTKGINIHTQKEAYIVARGRMWSSFVNPGHPIPADVMGLNDITNEMVADAPAFGEVVGQMVAPEVGTAIGYYAAHNAKFDRQWFDPPGAKWIDTCRVAQVLWPDAPNHKLGTLFYYLNIRLAQEAGQRHTALADAYIAAAILRRALHSGTLDEMVDVTENPIMLKRIFFGKHSGSEFKDIPGDYLVWMQKQTDMDPDAVYTAFHELQRRRDAAQEAIRESS